MQIFLFILTFAGVKVKLKNLLIMKKAILCLCAMLASGYAVAQSGAKFMQGEEGTENKQVSSNGRYLVGENTNVSNRWGLDNLYGYVSFVQNLETGEKTWLTSFDETDYGKMGSFTDVSDDGLICGTAKDPDNILTVTEWGETYSLPLNTAAVWTTDGQVKRLGMGSFSVSDFSNFNDGSFATAISKDGKVVAGYISAGNYAEVYPVRWTLDEATGEYTYTSYSIPEGCTESMVNDLSGDGSVAVGYYKVSGVYYPCYWPTPDEVVPLDNGTLEGRQGCQAFCISDNGQYIGLTTNRRVPLMYVIGTNEYRTIGAYEEVRNVEIGGISDKGEAFGIAEHSNGGGVRPFWYSYAMDTATDFNYFIYRCADNIDAPYNFDRYSGESLSFAGVSADGSVIVGNSEYAAPWVLDVADASIDMLPPTISDFYATFTDLGTITITFERGSESLTGYTVKEYVVYRNGKEVDRKTVEQLDKEGTTSVSVTDTGVSSGTHYYAVAVNYANNADGTELLSPKSEEKSVYMDASFEFPLFDNFDSGSISSNGWSIRKDYGETDYQNWGCPSYMGFNGTNCLYSSVVQYLPYSYSVVSRHLDAREREEVYISYAHYWEYVNSRDWALDKDTISLELSTDDIHWEVIKDMPLCDFNPYRLTFDYIDLTPYAAGKIFQVRFRVHGQGAAQYSVRVENLTIDEKPQHEGMNDAMGFTGTDGNFHLTWKNSLDAYALSYMASPYMDAVNYTIGNGGKPFMAVNKFDAADLENYKGKYLTSVFTQINKVESDDTTPIRVAVVVFEDGKLIREQEVQNIEYNADYVIKLDEPVLIDGTKDMMIGLEILEHGADQFPAVYQMTESYVPGKSDLYSEDGGNTWLSLADFFEENPSEETTGHASWFITGNVTDTPEADNLVLDLNQYAYEVYKNGQKYTERLIYLLEPGFVDKNSVQGDSYQIRTFYLDGTVSELSNTVTNSGTTGIGSVTADGTEGEAYTVEDGKLTVNGNAERIEIYGADGVKLYEGRGNGVDLTGFGRGMFIVKVYGTDGKTESYKLTY